MKRIPAIILLSLATNTVIGQNTLLQKWGLKGNVKSVKDDSGLDEFDKNGDRISRTSYDKGHVTKTIKYFYKAPGLISQSITYDASDKQTENSKYEYDENNNQVNYTTVDNSGKVVYQETRTYSDKLHYISRYYVNGKLNPMDAADTITLDNMGRIVLLAKNYFGTYRKKLFSYQSDNTEPSREQTIDNGKLTFEKIKEFNTNGDVIKEILTDGSQSEITTFEYTYDKNGNFTKQVYKGADNGSWERKIKYY